ncbi:MAG: VPLPA-CTERM sorting domain-containing protein [Acidobacteria bacterium]|nr:VPLPA-CTERM sorting domain-containing protein [Acidobacteriota bacterium]
MNKNKEALLLTRCLSIALLGALLLPGRAHADPVSIALHSVQGGATAVLPADLGSPLSMGMITLPSAGAAVAISVTGLTGQSNYLVELLVLGASSAWNTLRLEVIDPLRDGDDGLDVVPYHEMVPGGFSTSNNSDGLSFAQDAGLERSALFAGGSATVNADETTDRGDVLTFAGVAGAAGELRLKFGLRDYAGGRDFLVLFSAADSVATPEPASMFLIGTGLAGLAAIRRRRRGAEVAG